MSESRKSILCIEDDRDTASLICEELVDRGFEVHVAYNGREGLTSILREPPDLVLSDIGMPGMSGFELLERLTSMEPRLSACLSCSSRRWEITTMNSRGGSSAPTTISSSPWTTTCSPR